MHVADTAPRKFRDDNARNTSVFLSSLRHLHSQLRGPYDLLHDMHKHTHVHTCLLCNLATPQIKGNSSV